MISCQTKMRKNLEMAKSILSLTIIGLTPILLSITLNKTKKEAQGLRSMRDKDSKQVKSSSKGNRDFSQMTGIMLQALNLRKELIMGLLQIENHLILKKMIKALSSVKV